MIQKKFSPETLRAAIEKHFAETPDDKIVEAVDEILASMNLPDSRAKMQKAFEANSRALGKTAAKAARQRRI